MLTVNSLSGGKTSSFIAANYKADLNVFALVCIDCHNAGGAIDWKIKQLVNDRLQKHSSHWPEFVATSEDPTVLKTILDLEQFIGKEIIWLRGIGWEQAIEKRKSIPNQFKRWCTTMFKIEPIFEFLFLNTELPVKMNIGYRYDEKERAETNSNIHFYSTHCQYRKKSNSWVHRWQEIQWRVSQYPLIQDRITHPKIVSFWKDKGIKFAEDSNCQNCFWKHDQQLRRNFDTNKAIMQWSKIQEDIAGYTFKTRSLHKIEKLALQQEFNFGTGAGCSAGFCTN